MTYAVRGALASLVVLVSAIAVAPRARAASTSSTAAYVYIQVQGPAGAVYGYSASSSGQLTAIPGSPFKPGTQIYGATNSRLFTLGKTLLHSYALGSDGAIQAQESQTPFLNYPGSSCGGGTSGIGSAVLDHSGQYIYVLLQNGGDGTCSAYQTYKINSDGSFTFMGDTEVSLPDMAGAGTDLPSILGNESFAYADESSGHENNVIGFQRQSTGTLQLFGTMNPTFSGSDNYTPNYPDASPTGNYAVLQLYPNDSNPPQLGSFTVASNGDLSSTNTPGNMPTSALIGPYSTFSPDGTLFALYSNQGPGTEGNGIEIYNFNGAAPLTLYKTLLTGTPIDQVAWDSSGHLYALSRRQNQLWVFTVTPTSVTQDASVSIASPVGLVVASQTTNRGGGGTGPCTVPSGVGIHVCSPENGAAVTSPVQINAAANVSGNVYRFELWSGNTKLVSETEGMIDQSITLAPGTYHLTFDARNSSGDHQYAYRDITVTGSGSGGSCSAPSDEGVNVCSPAENATVASPVQIDAAANVSGGVYRFELWSGNTKLASVSNSGTMDQSVPLAPGTYHLTFDARSSSGDHQYAYRDVTVSAGGGAATQYKAPLLTITGPSAEDGQVTIDTSGNTTVQVTGQAANKTYTAQFCPAVDANADYKTPACFNVTTLSTNGSGNGSSTVKFPISGNWAGDFSVIDSSGKTALQTWIFPIAPSSETQPYLSMLLPESTTNGGVVATHKGQNPLTGGTVTYSSGTLMVTVKGALPNTNYDPVESNSRFIYNSSTYSLEPGITTDAAGNGSTSINLPSQGTEGGDMFTVEGGSGAGYIGGFSIP
jgi:hypothetical protein